MPEIHASELRYRRLFEAAQDGILILAFSTGKIEDANPFLLNLLGYTKEELIGKVLWEIGAMVDKNAAIKAFDTLQSTGYIRYEDLPLKTKQGKTINVEFVSNAYGVNGERVIQCNIRDISLRKLSEAALLHSKNELEKRNWSLMAYAHASMSLSNASDEADLINSVCNGIVDSSPFVLCWVGLAEFNAAHSIRLAGLAGPGKKYAQEIAVSWSAESSDGLGPSGRCIREGKSVVVSDILEAPTFAPWRDCAQKYGIRSSVATPIYGDSVTIGALMVYSKIPNAFSEDDIRLFENLANEIGYGLHAIKRRIELAQETRKRTQIELQLTKALESTIEAMSKTMEWRDPYTAGHQKRVAHIATAIGKEMGLDEARLSGLHLGCMVHDIGKVAIPAEILTKPGKLNLLEMQMVQQHAETGYEILKDIPFFWPIANMVVQHHERVDGSGYPHGLKGDQTLLEAKIIAVADTVEAMASHRPYRPALGLEAALKTIQAGRNTAFDPAVVDACLHLFQETDYQAPF